MLYAQRKQSRHRINELLYTAYHTALFERQKKLPPLKSVLISEEETKQAREMTDEEIVARCRLINAALGGSEVNS